MLRFLVLLLLLPLASHAQWTTEQQRLATATAVLFVVDYGQTRDLIYRQQHRDCSGGCYQEQNPILGKRPSRGKVNTYFLLAPLATYLVLDNIDSNSRTWALRVLTAIEVGAVGNNVHLGLSVRF